MILSLDVQYWYLPGGLDIEWLKSPPKDILSWKCLNSAAEYQY